MHRTTYKKGFRSGGYYLSVTTRDLTRRKIRWEKELENHYHLIQPGYRIPKPTTDPEIGLVVKVDSDAEISNQKPIDMAHGVLATKEGILVAGHSNITFLENDLNKTKQVITNQSFNALHSLRATPNGYLVASPGTDAIFEISKDSGEIIWSWWATSNGFAHDQTGQIRNLKNGIDHRLFEYPVRYQTTHVNSADILRENLIIATLFHQGSLICIDRDSGRFINLIDKLSHPHAIRIYADGTISFADSGSGTALHGYISGGVFRVRNTVKVTTKWLKDCFYKDGVWFLVDSGNAKIFVIDDHGSLICHDEFDQNWYLYDITFSENFL